MKKFTVVFASLLTVLFIGMLCFVGFGKDFAKPGDKDAGSSKAPTADNPIWKMTPDDLARWMVSAGFADSPEIEDYADCGLCTRWFSVDGKVDVLWWDLENLQEGDHVYKCYQTALNSGTIDGGSAFQLPVLSIHGPFAVSDMTALGKQADAFVNAFEGWLMPLDRDAVAVPPADNPIWSAAPEDLAQYLLEKGITENAEVEEYVDCGVCTRWVCVGGAMDVLWWDLPNLEESSNPYRCYQTVLREQVVDGGSAFQLPVFSVHGPFAVSDYSGYTGDPNELIAAFEAWFMEQ